MKLRYLIAIPLTWSLVALILGIVFYAKPEASIYWTIEIEAVRLFWIFGCLAAGLMYQPGDYLRRAWILLSVNMLMYLIRDISMKILDLGIDNTYSIVIESILVIAGNVFIVLGVLLLARAWKVAELKLPGSKYSQWATYLVAAIAAVAIAGPAAWTSINRVCNGEYTWLVNLASALGDTISLCLIAPMFLTALALRGGHLSWPWFLLTISMLLWLFYDAAYMSFTIGVDKHAMKILVETLRALACMFGFSAGLAQRMVISRMLKGQSSR